jgi:phosphoribosyl-ATP pyrophosphohydrolase/phosphoribosyl-AMP cyclohydrolase
MAPADAPPAAAEPTPPTPAFDDRGLVAAVAQDVATGAVLMVAWMNAEAWALTRATGEAHFWSRSRQRLWRKGESSGHVLRVVDVRLDCDADTVLLQVHPHGPACHTGATTCFFTAADGATDDGAPGPASAVLGALERVLIARRDGATAEKSYTRALLDGGFPKILAKIAEEHGELAEELPDGEAADVVHEAADLLFHVLVGLVARRIPVDDVWRELGRRFGVGGHVEKASRGAR